jgi:hypothetical protein
MGLTEPSFLERMELMGLYPSRAATNADRIRAMTDAELSDFLGRQRYYPVWCDDNCQTACRNCCLKWLKEEVRDGSD